MSLLVFGHKNPDTDSICSSIALSYLKNQLGFEAKPYALGEVRKEAQFALDYFKVSAPELLTDVKGKDVILVDHNELAQTADGIEEANIVEIVDHHKVEISTEVPISIRVMPVGCTCTIVYQMYKENNVEVPYEIAGLLLSAILSDTLLFKSPTTTEMDKLACEELSKIANVDMESYAMEMFKAGTSLDSIFAKKDEFLSHINSTDYDMLVLAITDIIKEGSYLIYKAEDKIIAEAFSVDASQGVFAEGVVSRKKQLVPNLTTAIKNI